MADGTNVGKINLQIDLSQDLQGQIDEVANKTATELKGAFEKGLNLDGLFNGIQSKFDSIMSNVNNALDSIQSKVKAITQSTSGWQMNAAPASGQAPQSSYKVPNVKIPSIPKINNITDLGMLKAQIDSITNSLNIVNAMIHQQQTALEELKVSYAATLNEAKRNTIEGQMLKAEQRINSLTATSDKLGFTLSALDDRFNELSNGADNTSDSVDRANGAMKRFDTNTQKTSRSASAYNRTINQLGLSHTMFGRILDRMLVRMVVFNLVIRQIENFAKFLGDALMTNQQFATSLAQIKSNLEVAFMPIYQACLPAINALMSALARVTTYIAVFVNSLFGKTYQGSAAAAKKMNSSIAAMKDAEKQAKKTGSAIKGIGDSAKKASGPLMGFDEINQLSIKEPKTETGTAPMPIVAPPVDVSATSGAMGGITAAANEFKKILSTLFAPMKAAWASEGAGVIDAVKAAFNGTIDTVKHFFDMLATPPVQSFLTHVNELILALAKLALKIYSGFILPIINWFIGLLPGAAKGLDPIVQAVRKFVDYLAGPGFKYVQIFLSAILGVVAGIKTFEIVTTVTKWFMDLGGKVSAVGGMLKGLWGVMMANPIALVIAIIVGLVAAFIALYNSNEQFRQKVNEVWAVISNYLNPILQILKNILLDVWHMAVEPLAKILKDVFAIAFKIVASVAKDLWQNVLVPLGNFLADIFAKIIESVNEIWQRWKPTIQTIIDAIMWLWNNVLQPLIDFLAGVFITVFHDVFTTIGNIIDDIRKVFGGLIDFITGVFTGNWAKAWQGIKEIFRGVWEGIKDICKGAINIIIDAVNGLIKGLNKIHFKVPNWDWLPDKVQGKSFGINIPTIPHLAAGGIIDQPTLAFMGEQNRKEAVVPLENSSAMQELGATIINGIISALRINGSNSQSSNKPENIYLQIDGTTFARIMMPYWDKEHDRVGNKLIVKTI